MDYLPARLTPEELSASSNLWRQIRCMLSRSTRSNPKTGTEKQSAMSVTTSRMYEFFGEVRKPFDLNQPAPTPNEMKKFVAVVARYGYWMGSPEENAAIGIRL